MLLVKKTETTINFDHCVMCKYPFDPYGFRGYSVYTADKIYAVCRECREVVVATMSFKIKYPDKPVRNHLSIGHFEDNDRWDIIEE